MNIKDFIEIIDKEFFVGVPDSTLTPLTDYLYLKHGISKNHIVAANEGNAVAIAAGYHLATGKIPVVYFQNSGLGNAVNPVCSLLSPQIYGIPCIFIIGWRGEPGTKDEPQHVFQGEITTKLLDNLDIDYIVVDKSTSKQELSNTVKETNSKLKEGKSFAFVIKKGALENEHKVKFKNAHTLYREEIIDILTQEFKDAIIVSTTGKASRELFEIRERNKQSHDKDFLTVGSMGHCSSIALGIALQKPEKQILCIDGDGSLLMHLGAMALIGANAPSNFIHIVINNGAHESVGGLPSVGEKIKFNEIAKSCGYKNCFSLSDEIELKKALETLKTTKELTFLEVKAQIGARQDLGRPTIPPIVNKKQFMINLHKGVEQCKQ